MPRRVGEFKGFGRIETINAEVNAGRSLSIGEVISTSSNVYAKKKEPYAWSWALCLFLENHPDYQQAFHKLKNQTESRGFKSVFEKELGSDRQKLLAEWELFIRDLGYGYDFERARIDFRANQKIIASSEFEATVTIDASKGWQATGITVLPDVQYTFRAEGETTLATNPKPWKSTPDGISFRYFRNAPLGLLQAVVYRPNSSADRTSGLVFRYVAIWFQSYCSV